MLSGVKCPNSDISYEEGQNTLKILSQSAVPVDYEELKERMLSLAGISKIAA